MADCNIKIAVRVRPFNPREIEGNAQLVVEMNGACTTLLPPPQEGKSERKYEPRSFTFDYSYWTHDGYSTDPDGKTHPLPGSNYADQQILFDNLGGEIMSNAWKGFNTTLLAYGQTGSGKSYSMFGYGTNRGLIPMFCEDLFVMIVDKKKNRPTNSPEIEYTVAFSMLEIYQDKVNDLLDGGNAGDNLKVRNHPKLGFYVEGLKSIPVTEYPEIEKLCDRGTKNRTVASTRMNATSSRSHTILMITFAQINRKDNTEKRSVVNLVDLAGSERQGDTQAEGQRLKEGANINGSLTVLGQVISGLVLKQTDKKYKNMVIPYRDSTLTKLLANSLGGNSKTIMIGAISPSHDAYEDSLSTLRFLDRAKGIKNAAIINENPLDKVIRELREENEALKTKLLSSGGGGGGDDEEIRRQIKEQEKAISEMNKSWAAKLEEAMLQKSLMDTELINEKESTERKRTLPHFLNINEDPLLSGMVLHFIQPGEHLIGRRADVGNAEIQLSGLSIASEHGYVTWTPEKALLVIRAASSALIRVNGQVIPESAPGDEVNGIILNHGDRLCFGLSGLFVVRFPGVDDPQGAPKVTWGRAQREIAAAEGYSKLINDITEVLPAVQECNAIAEELFYPKRYVLVINKQDDPEDIDIRGLVSVKVKDFEIHTKWILSKKKFEETHILIKDMYTAYLEGGGLRAISDWPIDKNPFELGVEDWLIGSCRASFKTILSIPNVQESLFLQNFKGANEGILTYTLDLSIAGVDTQGLDASNDNLMIGKELKLKVNLISATGVRWNKGPLYCKYEIIGLNSTGFKNELMKTTQKIKSENPKFNDHFTAINPSATSQLISSLPHMEIIFHLYGEYNEQEIKNMYASKAGEAITMTPATPGTRLIRSPSFSGHSGIHGMASLERLEIKKQEKQAEIGIILALIELHKDDPDLLQKLIKEKIELFRHQLQLKPSIVDPKNGVEKAKEEEGVAMQEIPSEETPTHFLTRVDEMVEKTLTTKQAEELAKKLVDELEKASEESTAPDIEMRVRNRRLWEGFIINFRDLKEDEDCYKAKALELLDKSCGEVELTALKASVETVNGISIDEFDGKKPADKMSLDFIESVEKRHLAAKELVRNSETIMTASKVPYVAFSSLEPQLQSLKKETALKILQKYQVVVLALKKAENILMGEISQCVERGNHHFDEADKELMRNRERLKMMAMNGKAVGLTMDAIAMAESRMKQQSVRMDKLKIIINQQAARGVYLETFSKVQAQDIQQLKIEIIRLNEVITKNEKTHLAQVKDLGDQVINKGKQLGEELVNVQSIRVELSTANDEADKLKKELADQNRLIERLKTQETDEKVKGLMEAHQARSAEIDSLRKKLATVGSSVDNKNNAKVYPEVLQEEAPQPKKSAGKKCIIM